MRTGLPWLLGAFLFAATPIFAQSPLTLPDLKNTTMPSPIGPVAQEERGAGAGKQAPPLDPPPDSGAFTPPPAPEAYSIWRGPNICSSG